MKNKFLLTSIALLHIAISTLPTHVSAQVKQLWGMTSNGGQYDAGVIFNTDSSGNNETVRYSFYRIPGANPEFNNNLAQASDGNLYGMTSGGGANGNGVLFQYNPATSVYIKKIDFAGDSNGAVPFGSLIQASDGNLYGMTNGGGVNGDGVLFQYNPSTSILTKKIDFAGYLNGAMPIGDLMQASDGMLYGMTEMGGAFGDGVLFQFNPSTSILTKKIDFEGISNGSSPVGSLIQATDGNLYGMTLHGGANGYDGGGHGDGVLFQYNPSTSVLTKKIDFEYTSIGRNPSGSLIQASDGNLYGMTPDGGLYAYYGVLFQYNLFTSILTVKINFAGYPSEEDATGSLMQASDGNLYGMTVTGGMYDDGVLFQYNLSTSVLTKEIDFDLVTNGQYPYGSLIQASDGNFYGMTYYGGAIVTGGVNDGYGVLFQYNPSTFVLTRKIDFQAASNGEYPYGSLVQASDSNLYGMTYEGGANNEGVLFQYNPATSVYTKKIDFAGTSNGANPTGSLMQASDGNLYGMTLSGGANDSGVLFQYNPSTSVLTKKIDFSGSNGANPYGALVQASDGNLYGMTEVGGANNEGILFQFSPTTSILTKKIDFAGASNGEHPYGSLMQASDGNLYGMTYEGGANGKGVLFQYNPATFIFNKKFDFSGNSTGVLPYGSLIQASDGNLYGITEEGGANGLGVLFQYNPSTSVLTKKIDFAGTSNGDYPYGSPIQASDGNLYGMTYYGGAAGGGVEAGVLFQYNLATSTFTKKLDFNGVDGQNPKFTNLIETGVTNIYTEPLTTKNCAGNVTTVPYIIAGVYNTGNVFTAQLSNDSGSFALPVNIGMLSSVTTGTISATIPSNTLAGIGYRIRVVSSNPAVTGSDNGTNITINTLPTVTASSNSPVCTGSTLSLSSGGGTSYSWSGPDGFTSSLQNPVISNTDSTNAGTYIIMITNICGADSASTVATVIPSPTANFSLYADTNQLHHYIAINNSTGVPPLSYDWSWGDGTHDTIPYPSHTYADSGFYNICLSITDSTGCTSIFCDSSFHAMRTTNTMVYINVFNPLVTEVKEVSLQIAQVVLYPNPATNQLTIHTSSFHNEAVMVSVMNVLGQEASPPAPLSRRIGTGAGEGVDATIYIGNLSAGMYFLQMKGESGSVVRKFVKE